MFVVTVDEGVIAEDVVFIVLRGWEKDILLTGQKAAGWEICTEKWV
jgi:hypothetical protein